MQLPAAVLYISDKLYRLKFMSKKMDIQLDHLGFVRIEPDRSLKDYIDSYWFIDASCHHPQGFQEYLHPDGGLGFIFNYGEFAEGPAVTLFAPGLVGAVVVGAVG